MYVHHKFTFVRQSIPVLFRSILRRSYNPKSKDQMLDIIIYYKLVKSSYVRPGRIVIPYTIRKELEHFSKKKKIHVKKDHSN